MKEKRNLDGYFFVIKRDGKLINCCLSDMNDEEMQRVLRDLTKDQLNAIARGLANRLYQFGSAFHITMK